MVQNVSNRRAFSQLRDVNNFLHILKYTLIKKHIICISINNGFASFMSVNRVFGKDLDKF